MTVMHPHAAALKALLGTPGVHAMPGCADGMGARLIAEAGFKLGFVSGASVSALRLAQPEQPLEWRGTISLRGLRRLPLQLV